jgi:hypothetical protein
MENDITGANGNVNLHRLPQRQRWYKLSDVVGKELIFENYVATTDRFGSLLKINTKYEGTTMVLESRGQVVNETLGTAELPLLATVEKKVSKAGREYYYLV